MLDYEPEIFTWLVTSLREKFPDIYVTNNNANAPPAFPAVSVIQESNTNYLKTADENKENHVSVMYQCDIYTNTKSGKEQQARDIRNYISDLFLSKGFSRNVCQNIPNASDPSIYRITMRFKGVIGADGFVYSG